jgi:hypothetical protein
LIIVLTMVAERRNSPFERAAVDVELHGLQQVALRHGGDGARHFGGRPQQVVDQRVDRAFHVAPGAAGETERTRCRVLPSRPTTWPTRSSCCGHALIGGDDLVEGVGDAAGSDRTLRPYEPIRRGPAPHSIDEPPKLRRQEHSPLAASSASYGSTGRKFVTIEDTGR